MVRPYYTHMSEGVRWLGVGEPALLYRSGGVGFAFIWCTYARSLGYGGHIAKIQPFGARTQLPPGWGVVFASCSPVRAAHAWQARNVGARILPGSLFFCCWCCCCSMIRSEGTTHREVRDQKRNTTRHGHKQQNTNKQIIKKTRQSLHKLKCLNQHLGNSLYDM